MSKKWRRALGALGGLVVVLLIASQLLLPTIAANVVKSSLTPYASGVKISLSATPALKLLFGKADSVTAHADVLHAVGKVDITQLLHRTEATTNADATVDKLYTPQGVLFQNVTMRKRGAQLSGSTEITPSQVTASLPAGITLDVPAGASGPTPVTISAHLTILGQTLSASGVVEAINGGIYVVPDNSLIPSLKLFSDPRISIDSLHLNVSGGEYTFSATAHLPN